MFETSARRKRRGHGGSSCWREQWGGSIVSACPSPLCLCPFCTLPSRGLPLAALLSRPMTHVHHTHTHTDLATQVHLDVSQSRAQSLCPSAPSPVGAHARACAPICRDRLRQANSKARTKPLSGAHATHQTRTGPNRRQCHQGRQNQRLLRRRRRSSRRRSHQTQPSNRGRKRVG